MASNSSDRVKEDRIKELRNKLKTVTKGSTESVDAYLEQKRCFKDDLSSLGSPVEPKEFVRQVIAGLGPDYSSVRGEVLFRDPAPSLFKLRKFLLNRESLLAGGPDLPLYSCTGCGAEWHLDAEVDVMVCRDCNCGVLSKKRRRAIVEHIYSTLMS